MLSERNKTLLFFLAVFLTIAGFYGIIQAVRPAAAADPGAGLTRYPVPEIITADTSTHRLTISRYRQIGSEIHLLAYTSSSGLAPFYAVAGQNSRKKELGSIPKQPGAWLRIPGDSLEDGPVELTLSSTKDTLCRVTVKLHFDRSAAGEIADTSRWFRHGSFDDFLDVRVVSRNGKYFLKDFADYHDGRTRTYFLEGMIVDSLESGIEVRPGYLYTVVARWLDGPYTQWWNTAKNRTSRLQSVWIAPDTTLPDPAGRSALRRIDTPGWFRPSPGFNPGFDRSFPEFPPLKDKLVMMYRLNQDVTSGEYLKRGITHLPLWEHDVPHRQQHWTEAPGFFEDRDQDWFESLSRQEVEELADRVSPIGAYAYDFEFWDRQYTPAVKQRLLWFSHRLRKNQPDLLLFDYWGGSAYINTTFQDENGLFAPSRFLSDYDNPRSNHFNFEKAPDGDFFGNYFNVTAVDVYPRPSLPVGIGDLTLNNFLVLSAVHASRINRMIGYQKHNKTVWFAWNRFMPLYRDPPFPWHVKTTAPEGSLVFAGLETIPASQALALSLFSLVEGDGFYLWTDSQPWGKGVENYTIDDDRALHAPTEWWPADGASGVESFKVKPGVHESPRYWDYPSDFFALGNWMAHEVRSILEGGTRSDLPFLSGGKWRYPGKEQAVSAAQYRLPFVTSVKKGNRILVLAIDSFQAPHRQKTVRIRLPGGTEEEIELYGNWPSLYTGTVGE